MNVEVFCILLLCVLVMRGVAKIVLHMENKHKNKQTKKTQYELGFFFFFYCPLRRYSPTVGVAAVS